MFKELKEINSRPAPFQFYTADELWANEYTSKQMLEYHLNEAIDISSRNKNFIERSAGWIVSHFGVDDKTTIADFGCGPGLYTTRLAERGATVTGIDFSKNSLKYAQQVAEQKGLKINYVHTNYLDFETTHHFDLITMIMCDFCALSPEQREIILTKFSSLLKPGGSVLIDVYSMNSFNQKEESATYELNQLNGFWSSYDYYCFVNTFKYDREKVSLDKYTIIEDSKTRIVYNWLQYFSKESLSEEFNKTGFKIESFYSNVAGEIFNPEATEFAIVANKI
ncbi:methyltransferase domain-containing protein [Desulfobacula sp.]|uniref:class I SAM-dependent methyltransferase n=1 Tax=Desulfobacula sp. TaxID=2593537 RepID=UPI00263604B3|nr:methyltransferase domain-containing protein [Desulfobacula sp.]